MKELLSFFQLCSERAHENIEYDRNEELNVEEGKSSVLHLYNRLKQWRNFGKDVVNRLQTINL